MIKANRILEIDFMKGVGVFLVIIGHLGNICPDYIHAWIYSFHMPLFFFTAGIFAKKCNGITEWYDSIIKKSKHLLMPYVIYCTLFWGIDLLIQYNYYTMDSIVQIMKGMDPFGFLWFFYALFFISVLFSTLSKIGVHSNTGLSVVGVTMAIAGYLLKLYGGYERLGSILFGFSFYLSGYLAKDIILRKDANSTAIQTRYMGVTLGILSIVGTKILTLMSGNARVSLDIHHNYEVDILVTIVVAISGILFIYYLSLIMGNKNIISKTIQYVGHHSVFFYPLVTYLPIRIEYLINSESMVAKLTSKFIAIALAILLIELINGIKKMASQ